jgi:hypothetical protein
MDVTGIISELRSEREAIEQEIQSLKGVVQPSTGTREEATESSRNQK